MRTIQEFLGHTDSKTTQIYAHYAPSAHEVEMVNAAFAEEERNVERGAADEKAWRRGVSEARSNGSGSNLPRSSTRRRSTSIARTAGAPPLTHIGSWRAPASCQCTHSRASSARLREKWEIRLGAGRWQVQILSPR